MDNGVSRIIIRIYSSKWQPNTKIKGLRQGDIERKGVLDKLKLGKDKIGINRIALRR